MKILTRILGCLIASSLTLGGSFQAEAKTPNTSTAKSSVQHIFFKDNFGSNKLNAHLIKVDMSNPLISVDLALAYNNTNRKEKAGIHQ